MPCPSHSPWLDHFNYRLCIGLRNWKKRPRSNKRE
jgi:hypothetical protein